jgi:hypothetical protein
MNKIVLAFILGAILGVPLTALFGPIGGLVAVFIIGVIVSKL